MSLTFNMLGANFSISSHYDFVFLFLVKNKKMPSALISNQQIKVRLSTSEPL